MPHTRSPADPGSPDHELYPAESPIFTGMPERSTDWLEQARRDLQMAERAQESGFWEWACFISQQSAEKAINAVYQKKGAVAWGHSVADLLRGLSGDSAISPDIQKEGRSLDRWYIQARYPDGFPSGKPGDYISSEDASDAIRSAGRIIQFCEDLLA
jgi:HEPN domain-containing protein